jgi:hypothetical protein
MRYASLYAYGIGLVCANLITVTPISAQQNPTPKFLASPGATQQLVSRFIGMDIVEQNGKKVGDVIDVLFDRDGKIAGYVVAIGGFLGIGAKPVALSPSLFEIIPGVDGSRDKLQIAVTRTDLNAAPEFKRR